MLHTTNPRHDSGLLEHTILALLVACGVMFCPGASAHAQTQQAPPKSPPAPAKTQTDAASEKPDEPLMRDYKGVTVGMGAEEARQKLGEPLSKNDDQDFYAFSETETAQVFYDNAKKVSAISVSYVGAAGAPACKAVFGEDAESRPDGSTYKTKQYSKAGYWVSYSRTAGDSPVTTITIKKM